VPFMDKVLLIEWGDAVSVDEWTPRTEIALPPSKVLSVGFLIEETETHYTLALNVDTVSDSASCIMTIPKGMIKKVKRLKTI
jgi:hypothetical protein